MDQTKPPRWREIADHLLGRIQRAEFPREEVSSRRKLPSEIELQDHYKASRSTVRDALTWLANRGVVVSEQGKGTFVVFRPAPFQVTLSASELGVGPGGGEGEWYKLDAAVQGRRPRDSAPKVEIQTVPSKIAWYLGLPPETEVVSRHQEQYIDEDPWALQTSFYPLSFVDQGANRLLFPRDIPEGAVRYLGKTLGYIEAGYHDEIKARPPNDHEKRFFGLAESAADVVFEIVRTAYSAEQNAFRVTVTIWPADRNLLHYNIGEVPSAIVAAPGEPADGPTLPAPSPDGDTPNGAAPRGTSAPAPDGTG